MSRDDNRSAKLMRRNDAIIVNFDHVGKKQTKQ